MRSALLYFFYTIFICTIINGFLTFSAVAAILDPPHNESNGYGCDSCHDLYGGQPFLMPPWTPPDPQTIDDTQTNYLCWSCHNESPIPYDYKTHSSLQTGNKYGDWTVQCWICHNPHNQDQNNYNGSSYGKLIRRQVRLDFITGAVPAKTGMAPVVFTGDTGANSFADNDTVYDGICQVCHTKTNHFRNTGEVNVTADGYDHTSAVGTDCMNCHSHENGFAHGGGADCVECHGHDAGTNYDPDMTAPYAPDATASLGAGTVQSHSTHTETTGDDQKGPGIYCDTCHNINKFPLFRSVADPNAELSLDDTDVCNACHSKGGSYDGLDDSVVGAKRIWRTGAYVATDDSTLRADKEKWCATCHDEAPAQISGVTAPNVIGDEDGGYPYGIGWGYYKTGHGLAAGAYPASEGLAAKQECSGCHDFSTAHIDTFARTYSAASDNYQAGYRLLYNMDIPRNDYGQPVSDFELCFQCHSSDPYLVSTNYDTNFRTGATGNEHWRHNQAPTTGQFNIDNFWDSDWDGTGDSKASCTACHNVHGSPSPQMIRHGELISTPGTIDKVPGLNFKYLVKAEYPTLSNSSGGSINNYTSPGGGSIANTGICNMCHANNAEYTRTPVDEAPWIEGVFGNVGSDVLTVVFSEAVYTSTGSAGALVVGDFTFTDSDDGRTIAAVIHTAGGEAATVTLSSALDASNDINTDTLAAATATSIYDAGDNPMAVSPVVVTSDATPPNVSSQSPADSSIDNAPYSDITFVLADTGSGVDWTSFSIQLSGSRGYAQSYTDADTAIVTKAGPRSSYFVTVDPDVDFSHDETITVSVNATDMVGNAMAAEVWSFGTLTGGGPFTRVLHPSGIADNTGSFSYYGSGWADILDSNDSEDSYAYRCCGPGGEMFYVDMDDSTGMGTAIIQSITFHAYARWQNGTAPGSSPVAGEMDIGYKTNTNTVWRGPFTTDTTGNYNQVSSVTYTTDADGGTLDLTDVNNLQIAVNRYSPFAATGEQFRVTEVYAEITYGVPEGDATPPAISNISPANGSIDAAVDNNLTFTLADTGGGVDWTTFQIELTGDNGYSRTYTDLDTTEVTKTGAMASYEVTVNPDANFSLDEVITVMVNVDDNSGNSLVPPAWSFTTEAVSTPQTLILYPSGFNSSTGTWSLVGSWGTALDTEDGDNSYTSICCTASNRELWMDMDNPVGLDSATIQSVKVYAYGRGYNGTGPFPNSEYALPATFRVAFRTGTNTYPALASRPSLTTARTGADYTYDLLESGVYTLDSDGGALDLTDINNIQVNVTWVSGRLRVTQVYVEVTYIP